MPTQTKDPFVSQDPNVQARLIAMGAKGASADTAAMTQAVSMKTPGVLVRGGTGADGTQYQAMTTVNAQRPDQGVPMAKPTDPAKPTTRYNADGSVNTGLAPSVAAPSTTPAPTGPAGASPQATPGSIPTTMTAAEFQASRTGGVDEAAIREDVRKRQQARIDAVELAYQDILRNQGRANEANAGATRAVNARSGLIGSDFGNANDMNQRNAGNKAIEAIQAERAAKVNDIISQIDSIATKEIEAKKQEAIGNADAYSKYLDEAQGKAKEYIKGLGAAGMSLDQLKEKAPDQLAALLKNSGMDEFSLNLALNAARKPAEKIDWKTDIKGNNIIAYGLDPVNGQMVYQTKALPAEAQGNDVKILGDEIWSVSPDGKTATKIGAATKEEKPQTKVVKNVAYTSFDGGKTWEKAKGINQPAATAASGKKPVSESKRVAEAVNEMNAGIAAATKTLPDGSRVPWLGADGYIAPEDYLKLKGAWVSKGLSATTFDSRFKGIRNPQDTYSVGK
jgi:hypothetical protein